MALIRWSAAEKEGRGGVIEESRVLEEGWWDWDGGSAVMHEVWRSLCVSVCGGDILWWGCGLSLRACLRASCVPVCRFGECVRVLTALLAHHHFDEKANSQDSDLDWKSTTLVVKDVTGVSFKCAARNCLFVGIICINAFFMSVVLCCFGWW